MKKKILTALTLVSFALLVGCTEKNNNITTSNIDDMTIEVIDTTVSEEKEVNQAQKDFENAEFDEPLGDDGIVEDERGAFLVDLWKLEDIQNPMQFRADLDAYLIYCFPDIDKRYDTYILDASEKDNGSSYQFKVKVDNINPDGSNLIVKCIWYDSIATEHYNFVSDLTPNGTDVKVDSDGNIIGFR